MRKGDWTLYGLVSSKKRNPSNDIYLFILWRANIRILFAGLLYTLRRVWLFLGIVGYTSIRSNIRDPVPESAHSVGRLLRMWVCLRDLMKNDDLLRNDTTIVSIERAQFMSKHTHAQRTHKTYQWNNQATYKEIIEYGMANKQPEKKETRHRNFLTIQHPKNDVALSAKFQTNSDTRACKNTRAREKKAKSSTLTIILSIFLPHFDFNSPAPNLM